MGIRIIDANALTEDLTYGFTGHPMNGHRKTTFADIRAMILCQPTIDPETLPIVQDLRKKLEQVTAERDAAKRDIEKAMELSEHEVPGLLCAFCEKNDICVKCDGPAWRGPVAENATAGNGGQNDD